MTVLTGVIFTLLTSPRSSAPGPMPGRESKGKKKMSGGFSVSAQLRLLLRTHMLGHI